MRYAKPGLFFKPIPYDDSLLILVENKDPVAPFGVWGACSKLEAPAGPPMVPKGLLVPKAITYYFHSLFPERHLLDQTG